LLSNQRDMSLHQSSFAADASDSEDDEPVTSVVLAFADGPLAETDETAHTNKIGGRPAFAPVLAALPSVDCIKCLHCHAEMPLLVQICAPLEGDQLEPPSAVKDRDAWLRVLYVFGCVQKGCIQKQGK
jgi:hypothetical protein